MAAAAVEEEKLSVLDVALALAVPVAVLLTMIFVTWSVLMRSYDLTHVPLFALSVLPLAAAVAVPLVRGGNGPIDPRDGGDLTTLTSVVALVALAAIVEVIGHERVGFAHTMEVVERDDASTPSAAPRRPIRAGGPGPEEMRGDR